MAIAKEEHCEQEFCPRCNEFVEIETYLDATGLNNRCVECYADTENRKGEIVR
uniref:Uncharacterized protein n=1 Tax=viral metagenome TaxID=1070528 RepID=A0A6M3L6F9_9ZZZZ